MNPPIACQVWSLPDGAAPPAPAHRSRPGRPGAPSGDEPGPPAMRRRPYTARAAALIVSQCRTMTRTAAPIGPVMMARSSGRGGSGRAHTNLTSLRPRLLHAAWTGGDDAAATRDGDRRGDRSDRCADENEGRGGRDGRSSSSGGAHGPRREHGDDHSADRSEHDLVVHEPAERRLEGRQEELLRKPWAKNAGRPGADERSAIRRRRSAGRASPRANLPCAACSMMSEACAGGRGQHLFRTYSATRFRSDPPSPPRGGGLRDPRLFPQGRRAHGLALREQGALIDARLDQARTGLGLMAAGMDAEWSGSASPAPERAAPGGLTGT